MIRKNVTTVPSFSQQYVDQVPEDMDLLEALERFGVSFIEQHQKAYASLEKKVYAPGKWTIHQIMEHINDAERVFAYRAMRFARGDQSALVGMDQEVFTAGGNANDRAIYDIIDEFKHVRQSTIALFRSFDSNHLTMSGPASEMEFSVGALGFMICGHLLHHHQIIEERYYPLI